MVSTLLDDSLRLFIDPFAAQITFLIKVFDITYFAHIVM